MAPRARTVQCISPTGLHRMAYVEWGDPANDRVLLCVHGLTRTGRDFDVPAQRWAKDYRVVCPDIVGRGKSDWLSDEHGYQFPQYISDVVTLIARLGVDQVDYLGTSMGGLIGILLGAMPHSPIARMVVNDVGPRIEPASLVRLNEYLGQPTHFATAQDGVDHIRRCSEGFGRHTQAQWRALNAPMLKRVDGGFALRSDPAIAQAFRAVTLPATLAGEIALWHAFEALRCPVLVVRGAESDLLSRATLAEMGRRGRHVQTMEVAGAGHAPTFVDPDRFGVVDAFFHASSPNGPRVA